MGTPARFRHDPDDPKHLLYCSTPGCWEKRPKFRMGGTLVDLELASSSIMMVLMPSGPTFHHEFKPGGEVRVLECSNCGEKYYPHSAYDPA